MQKKQSYQRYQIFLIMFLVLNIFNTYFLTTHTLNRYIASFEHTLLGEVTAILGNAAVLLLFIFLVEMLFKSFKARMITLTTITLILNFFIFTLGIFSLYYGTAFSTKVFSMFNNPSGGFAGQTAIEAFKELIVYYRILVFIPFFVLLTWLIMSLKHIQKQNDQRRMKRILLQVVGSLLIVALTTMMFTKQIQSASIIQSSVPSYATQNYGVYPYYLNNFLGFEFDIDEAQNLQIENDQDALDLIADYNKNVSSYINPIDQQTYSHRLTIDQADIDYLDPSIQNGNELNGILANKNLVLVHLESLNYFLLQNAYTKEQMSFLQHILSESYTFSNFYTNVGMGVSSDAESTVLTGMNPQGDQVLYWDYVSTKYQLPSLVDYFNQDDYYTEAIHGDAHLFYNREMVYDGLYGFDEFYSLEDFVADGYDVDAGYVYDTEQHLTHISPWVSDYYLADYTSSLGQSLTEPFMLFPITMMGHTPFDFGPDGTSKDIYPMYAPFIQDITLKYINYANYYSEIIKRFFISDDGTDQTLDDTVYVFYSDHGSSLKNGDLDILFDRSLSDLEERQILQQTLAFIYVPSNDTYVDFGDYQIRKGMLVGNQTLVRSEVDLYRTIIELFDLDVGNDMYFGVNGLSTEPTFALDNRILDVVMDDVFFSLRNTENYFPENATIDSSLITYIRTYKMLNDYLLSTEDQVILLNEKLE